VSSSASPPPSVLGFPRAVTVLVAIAAGLVAVLALQQLAWLVAPVFLALVIVVLVHPVYGALRRLGVPAPIAMAILLIAIYGVIVGIAAILVFSVGRLASILPQYSAAASGLVGSVLSILGDLGVGPDERRALASSLDFSRLASGLLVVLRHVGGFAANVTFLLSLLLFLGVESAGAAGRLDVITSHRPALGTALRGFIRNTRRFLTVTTIFGFLTGFVDTLLLLWMGIPLAPLWGLLAAVCNYIPYVGFVIGVVPPALLALLSGGWQVMLLLIIAYVVINSVLTSWIQPYFVGDAVGLSITVTFIALVFWGWVLGPLGAILAIPLTLLVKAVMIDTDSRAAWAQALVGSTPKPRQPRRRRGQQAPPVVAAASGAPASEVSDEGHKIRGGDEPAADDR
jgi:AI-2 transport protein TqsA